MTQLMFQDLILKLKEQKEFLGISYAILSQRSGVSEATVKRIFSGKHSSAHFEHIIAVADVLGVWLTSKQEDADEMRNKQAEQKAERIIDLVRGNSALEGNSIDQKTYQRMLNKTKYELLTGPKNALWA